MNIWIVTAGEPLPTDEIKSRLHRSGQFAARLSENHNVIWWTTCFDHISKKHRSKKSFTVKLSASYEIRAIKTFGYKTNVSVSRFLDHWQLSKRFKKKIQSSPLPDVIVASYPTIDLCFESVKFGMTNNVPVIVDVRDLWPDIFVEAFPKVLQIFAKLLLDLLYKRKVKTIFSKASSIIGVSKKYLSFGLSKAKKTLSSHDRVFELGYLPNRNLPKDGIEASFFKKLGVDPSRPIILFAGTFGKTYDLEAPIKTALDLNKNPEDSTLFIFCGSGENEKKWKNMSRGANNIIFTGWLDESKLQYVLSISDVGLAAYVKNAPQGLPNKIIEYMAFGLPILSSLRGEAESLLIKNNLGFTYDPKNVESFKDSLNKILKPEMKIKISKNCNEKFESDYSSTLIYEEFEKHLLKVKEST